MRLNKSEFYAKNDDETTHSEERLSVKKTRRLEQEISALGAQIYSKTQKLERYQVKHRRVGNLGLDISYLFLGEYLANRM